MSLKKSVEVCSFSLKSSIIANECRASRIELCGGRAEGGTTPSHGLIKNCLDISTIPIRIMIRPRGGDFLYSDTEFQTMKEDILAIKPFKPEGFVFGILNADGSIDVKRMKELVELCDGFKITFHRAFDMVANQAEELKKLIDLNINTILTSGGKNSALAGIKELATLKKLAEGKIEIMAGAGVNAQNVLEIADTGVDAIHLTAKSEYQSEMQFRNMALSMSEANDNEEYTNYETDPIKLQDVIQKLAGN